MTNLSNCYDTRCCHAEGNGPSSASLARPQKIPSRKKGETTKPLNLPDLLQCVVAAAEDAGRLLADEFVRADGPRGAGGHADVDDEIEATLRERLLKLLPARWRGEETGVLEGAGGPYCWLVDPHDGTSAF